MPAKSGVQRREGGKPLLCLAQLAEGSGSQADEGNADDIVRLFVVARDRAIADVKTHGFARTRWPPRQESQSPRVLGSAARKKRDS